jgi:ATP-dependent Zn protease
MSEILNPGSVDQITVTSRGNALGYVRHTQKEEQILYTRTGLEKEIMVLLAGSVSEELFLSERSTGAANDFQRAIELAQKIVSCGLSKLGVVSTELLPEKEYFETCQEIIRALEEKTKGLLAEKKVLFQELVALLKAKEKVSGVEVRKILSENQDALAC